MALKQQRADTINLQELCSEYSPEPSQSRNSPDTAKDKQFKTLHTKMTAHKAQNSYKTLIKGITAAEIKVKRTPTTTASSVEFQLAYLSRNYSRLGRVSQRRTFGYCCGTVSSGRMISCQSNQ